MPDHRFAGTAHTSLEPDDFDESTSEDELRRYWHSLSGTIHSGARGDYGHMDWVVLMRFLRRYGAPPATAAAASAKRADIDNGTAEGLLYAMVRRILPSQDSGNILADATLAIEALEAVAEVTVDVGEGAQRQAVPVGFVIDTSSSPPLWRQLKPEHANEPDAQRFYRRAPLAGVRRIDLPTSLPSAAPKPAEPPAPAPAPGAERKSKP